MDTARKKTTLKKVNLALQGGGSHGAFTWGVLDALLEDGRLGFEAITGASAGAMNAVIMADGMLDNPRDPYSGARQGLHDFWHAISSRPGFDGNSFGIDLASFKIPGFSEFSKTYALDKTPAFIFFDLLSRLASPYQLNPLNINPLRNVLEKWVDFPRLNKHCSMKLFVCATNVRTGRPRIFTEAELNVDMLLASSCLPFFFQAQEIGQDIFWDGGYSGNPPLFPLHQCTKTHDLLLVQINPLIRDDLPNTSSEIIDRVNEISFNTALMLEMRSIEFVQRLLSQQSVDTKHYKSIYLHIISAEEELRNFGASSKFNTSWEFLMQLRDIGRATAKTWLTDNFDTVGKKGSVDIAKTFL
jgi:NTE family protein